jgi:hypothetical protein
VLNFMGRIIYDRRVVNVNDIHDRFNEIRCCLSTNPVFESPICLRNVKLINCGHANNYVYIHVHSVIDCNLLYKMSCIFPVSKAFEEVRNILSASGSEIQHEYNIGPTFQGFSATMSER